MVADEVRKLAEGSGKTAGEIGKLLETINASTEKTSELMVVSGKNMETTRVSMGEMSTVLTSLHQADDQVKTFSKEVSGHLQQIETAAKEVKGAVDMLSDVANESAAAMEETAVATSAVSENVKIVSDRLGEFKV